MRFFRRKRRRSSSWRDRLSVIGELLSTGADVAGVVASGGGVAAASLLAKRLARATDLDELAAIANAVVMTKEFIDLVQDALADRKLTFEERQEILKSAVELDRLIETASRTLK